MMNEMAVYGVIVMAYLSVAVFGLFLLLRRKPASKRPVAKIIASAKDFAASTMQLAALNVKQTGIGPVKHVS